MEDKKLTYKDAGVDTKEGERAVSLMKEHVKGTFNENVLTGLGSFGSLFNLDVKGMEQPVLVSGTDGVGTKLKIAFLITNVEFIFFNFMIRNYVGFCTCIFVATATGIFVVKSRRQSASSATAGSDGKDSHR